MNDHRVYPQAIASEKALLGGMIIAPDRIPDVAGLRVDDFHRPEHQKLYELLVGMSTRGEAIDLVTVPEACSANGEQDRYGGISYVVGLPDNIPSTTNLEFYAKKVKEQAVRRRAIDRVDELRDSFYDGHQDPQRLVEHAVSDLLSTDFQVSSVGWARAADLAVEEEARLQAAEANPEQADGGISTGFVALDRALSNIHPADLIILAGRPAMGKTGLALGMANRMSRAADPEDALTIGVFSMEMSKTQVTQRLIGERGLVPAGVFRSLKFRGDDLKNIAFGRTWVQHTDIRIDDTPGLTLDEVTARSRRLHAQCRNGVSAIIVDYLQLMEGDPRISREQVVSRNSRGLKALAKDLECPVIALSQLNRGVEQRKDKRPMVSDLRESGAIEQDADVILFLYRDEHYYGTESVAPGVAEVIVAKNRHGPNCTVRLAFQSAYVRFDDLAWSDE